MKHQFQNILNTLSFILNSKIYLSSDTTFKRDITKLNNILIRTYNSFTNDLRNNNIQLKKILNTLIKSENDFGFLLNDRTLNILKYYSYIIQENYTIDAKKIIKNIQSKNSSIFNNPNNEFVNQLYNLDIIDFTDFKNKNLEEINITKHIDSLIIDKQLINSTTLTHQENIIEIANSVSTEIKKALLTLHFPHEKTFSTIALNSKTKSDSTLGSFRTNNKIINLNDQDIHNGTLVHEAFHLLDSHIANSFGFKSNLITEIIISNPHMVTNTEKHFKTTLSKNEKNFIHILDKTINQDENSLFFLPPNTPLNEKISNLKIYSKKYLNINIDNEKNNNLSRIINNHISSIEEINLTEKEYLHKTFNDYLNNQSNRNLFSIFAEIYDFTRTKGLQSDFNIDTKTFNNKNTIYYRKPTELLARIFQSKVDKTHLTNTENIKLYPLGTERKYLQSLAETITTEYSMINGQKNIQKYKSSDISLHSPLERLLKTRQSENTLNNYPKLRF